MKKLLFFTVLILALAFLGFSAGITVDLPSGGPNYYKGTTHNITWTKGGSCTGSSIKINIFKDSVNPANFVEQLTAGISATSKSWTIGMGYVTGTYIIRVKTDDNSCFGDSPTFSVTNAPGGSATITVGSPNASSPDWCINSTKTITWSTTGVSNGTALKINIFKNSIDPANFVEQLNATNGTNSGSKSWTINSGTYTPGNYQIRIKTADNSVFGDSDSFTLKNCASPGTPCFPFYVSKPAKGNFYWSGFSTMNIQWKPKYILKKKVEVLKANPTLVKKQKMIIAEKVDIHKLRMVKIEIRTVACPIKKVEQEVKLKRILVQKKLSTQYIKKIIAMPWIVNFFKWKTIAITYDDGSYPWKIPSTYKKGCYQIRVTRLWCDASDKDRSDVSETFHIYTFPIEIFQKMKNLFGTSMAQKLL